MFQANKATKMTEKEFWEYVEVEGLEYFLNHKTNEWHYLENKELLNRCHKYVDVYSDIMAFQPEELK
jgi:hypothetical protein